MSLLSTQSDPYEIELPYGIFVTVKPLTSAGMSMAQHLARRTIGKEPDNPTPEEEAERDALYNQILIETLAVRHITAWRGIEDDPDVSADAVKAVMALYPVGERFFQEFTLRQVLRNAAKNGLRPDADGTSAPAAGRHIARTAQQSANPVPTKPKHPKAKKKSKSGN